jgi:hypothetical protein
MARPRKPDAELKSGSERSRKSRWKRWCLRKKLLREIDAEGIAKTIRSISGPGTVKLKGSLNTPAERERAWKRAMRRMFLYGREQQTKRRPVAN